MFEWHIPSCLEGHFLGIRRGVELHKEEVTFFYYVYKRFFKIFVTFIAFLTFLKFLCERFSHLCSAQRDARD